MASDTRTYGNRKPKIRFSDEPEYRLISNTTTKDRTASRKVGQIKPRNNKSLVNNRQSPGDISDCLSASVIKMVSNADFQSKRPPFRDDDAESVHTTLENYDPAKHNPVFYGKMHRKVPVPDDDILDEADPATSHPAVAGHVLLDKPPKPSTPPAAPLPDLKTSSPKDYLEAYIFPVLLPALEEMLKQAKTEKCFERKRTKFNGCDFLTEYLYNHNPKYTDRDNIPLGQIPFVAEHWKIHPRPPLPKSLLWTEEEAALIVQAHYRGYKVRCDPEIQELRQWQREWREENANINNKVRDFWAKQMPDADDHIFDDEAEDVNDEKLPEKSSAREQEEKQGTERSFVTGDETGMLDSRDAQNGSQNDID